MDLLEELHRWEIGTVLWVQDLPGWLTPIMWLASAVGTDGAVLVLLATVYWCVSPRVGIRLGLAVLLSAGLNAVAKLAFHAPRPAWIDPRVEALTGERSFGMPSGHAQTSVVATGVGARVLDRPAAWWGAFAVAALICLSRVHLGVHFPTDVLGGLLIGALVLGGHLLYADRLGAWWRLRSLPQQVLLSAAAAGALLGAGLVAEVFWQGWTAPPTWGSVSQEGPSGLTRVTAMAGALFGALAGASAMRALGWFSTSGTLPGRALRLLIGGVGAGVLWLAAWPLGTSVLAGTFRYTVVAAWIVLGAPLVFLRLGLAVPDRRDRTPATAQ
ncbi:phosphatase PAP2 family protein [Spongiactinospora rosea]|uniref:phosphatase PAP2 family protein n=1 Tax=Spongiactinospora rosea TaxID=2248750 RepID=UPI0011C0475C|nr:phosphatase PAP2 family protein [Spongiactinospora rosea]